MVSRSFIKSFSITVDFEKEFDLFLKTVQRDQEFLGMLKNKTNRTGAIDKRYSKNPKNKRESVAIRYAISYYLRDRLEEEEEEIQEQNVKTKDRYIEEISIE